MNECPYCGKPALSMLAKLFRGRYPFNRFKCRNCGKRVQIKLLYSFFTFIIMVSFMALGVIFVREGYDPKEVIPGALFVGFGTGLAFFLLKAPIIPME